MAFSYLSRTQVAEIAGVDDKASYAELRTAMGAVGMSEAEGECVCEALAGTLPHSPFPTARFPQPVPLRSPSSPRHVAGTAWPR